MWHWKPQRGCKASNISIMAIALALFYAGIAHAAPKPKKTQKFPALEGSPKDYNTVKEDGRTVIYKKRNVVEFDDSLIEGDVRNPNEFYFVHRPKEEFRSLIKRRQNFHKEMLRDTVMIR